MAERDLQSKINNTINTATAESTLLPNKMPRVTDLASLQQYGSIILSNPDFINEFANIINRIAEVIVWNKAWRNPLEFLFKDGEYGNSIEEIFVNTAKIQGYDAWGDGADQWKRAMPDVRSAIHMMNAAFFAKQTVYDKGLKKAFLSYESFNTFFQGIITALYNAISQSLFHASKYTLALSIIETGAAGTYIPKGSKPEEFTIALKTMASNLGFLSTKYNSAGVETFSTIDDLYLFVTPEWDARQDVEVLAYMFNVELGRLPWKKIVVDDFWNFRYDILDKVFPESNIRRFRAEEIAKLKEIKAVLVDKNALLLYDMMHSSEVARNKQKLYENYFLHFWGLMSYSPFANLVVFAEGEPNTVLTGWKNPYGSLNIDVGRDNQFYALPATAYGTFTEQVNVDAVVTGTGLTPVTGQSGWYQAGNTRGETATITYAKPAGASEDMEDLVITVRIV